MLALREISEMKKTDIKPNDCIFNIVHDPDIGFYVVISERNPIENQLYNKMIDRIVPVFFYKLDNDYGNTYGFSVKPEEAREALKRMGFVEDLDLI